ncbi:hypothetical protein [Streptomyces sp. NPDC046821]|uniref:hypothetical protein n=1 Tax=Streptomyces sp. NPDC046821 TaxID=3154702 RepID=UPI0033EDEAEF
MTVQLDGAGRQLDELIAASRAGAAAKEVPVFVDDSGRRNRRYRRFGAVVGMICAVYAVVIVATLLSGNSTAPWLPIKSQDKEKPAGEVKTPRLPADRAKRSPSPGTTAGPGLVGTEVVTGESGKPGVVGTSAGPSAPSGGASGKPSAKPGSSPGPKPTAGPGKPAPGKSPAPGPGPSQPPVSPAPGEPSPSDSAPPAEPSESPVQGGTSAVAQPPASSPVDPSPAGEPTPSSPESIL